MSNKLREEFAKHRGKTPVIQCKRMEFNFYEGMKYGKFDVVPLASKAWMHPGSNGDFFSLYENYMDPNDLHFGNSRLPKPPGLESFIVPPSVESDNETSAFSLLGIKDNLIQILKKEGVTQPADIQVEAIPPILEGKNCVVSAHTGCGKTLAYILPMLQKVLDSNTKEGNIEVPHESPKAIILTPSRELTYQIYEVLQKLTAGLPLSCRAVVGGYANDGKEFPEVVDIVVASLGTFQKKLNKGALNLQRVQYIVLDEADQLADDQNRSIVRWILRQVQIKQAPDEKDLFPGMDTVGSQIVLASATMPTNLESLFGDLVDVQSLERVCTTHLHNVLKSAPQLFLKVGKTNKGKALVDLVEKDVKHKRPVLIFSNTVKTADWVSFQLNDCGFPCKNLTSNVPTAIRQHLFQRFQEGEFDILSTTPMVARGLDTVRVKHIINFDFPLYVSEYIHQIGRVGRIGSSKSCHITNIIAHPREVELVRKIELSVRLNQKLDAVNANIPGIIRHRREKAEEQF